MVTLSHNIVRQGTLSFFKRAVKGVCYPSSSALLLLSSISSVRPTAEDIRILPEGLNVLKDAYKMRINQTKLTRIGLKPTEIECIREFEVVDTLTSKKLLFIQLYHAMKVEKYEMKTLAYCSQSHDRASGKGPCLIKMNLERNKTQKSVAAKIYSPPDRPIANVYDLAGIHRTAIIEDGAAIKCLYQLHTNTPFRWTSDGKIYSGRGNTRLGHFRKLMEGDVKREILIFLRLHQELDIMSKCILMGAALFLMSYEHVR